VKNRFQKGELYGLGDCNSKKREWGPACRKRSNTGVTRRKHGGKERGKVGGVGTKGNTPLRALKNSQVPSGMVTWHASIEGWRGSRIEKNFQSTLVREEGNSTEDVPGRWRTGGTNPPCHGGRRPGASGTLEHYAKTRINMRLKR